MAHVLIIEDEDVLAKHIRRALMRRGHTATLATTVTEGARLFAEIRPDLTLLDVGLPDGSGLDLLRTLGGHDPRARVVVMTAYTVGGGPNLAARFGAAACLEKPFDIGTLTAIVDRLLAEA
jgi:two-component system KDP operon response regulator KdpE